MAHGVRVFGEGQQQMFEGRVLVAPFVGETERPVERLF
jgi:hypothetical protein